MIFLFQRTLKIDSCQIFLSVSILVRNTGKFNVKKDGGKEDIEVDLNEVNFTVESALDILSVVSFDTFAAKLRKYLFGAILRLSMEMVFDFAIKGGFSLQHDYLCRKSRTARFFEVQRICRERSKKRFRLLVLLF